MTSIEAAAIVTAGAALVLAPIDPQPLREPTAPPATPVVEPEPEIVVNFDSYGTRWGTDTLTATEALITSERAAGTVIHEWTTVDRNSSPLRIVRLADPTFLDTICVIPA